MARASNFILGAVTLAAIGAAFGGFLASRKYHAIAQRGPLRVVFEGSASGLIKGGSVNFDGVQVGEVLSVRLDGPRKIVALTTVENSAPIRKDTVVGLEAQGLTGIMAIALTGGEAAAAPVPLDADGVPTLTADLSEAQSIRDTLHNVDHVLVDNRETMKNGMLSFETYTATLAGEGDEIDSVMRKADTAFASFDSMMTKIDDAMPDLGKGKNGELYKKLQSIRETADSLRKRSVVFIDDGRRTLQDISDSAIKVTRKFDPPGTAAAAPPTAANASVPRRRP
ncbi:MAG TPA: MlaD family protein [Bradyrhizobium sp.]|jgi:phospholipid/cholesterol/gamma-HCH transport system substrate-binding protein|nr:MlaD family protein [Bradyrhizobium sp.]